MSDDVPTVEVSADGLSISGGSSIPGKLDPESSGEDPLENMMTSCCGCGCGCGCGGSGCSNTAPFVIGNEYGTGCTLAELFLDYYGTYSNAIIDLSFYFDDNEQLPESLQYSIDSNSNPSIIAAGVAGSILTVTAISSPGISNIVVRATDDENAYGTWTITAWAVEVTGYELEERAWSESSYDPPEDSGADWNVIWKSDAHRWHPKVLPVEAYSRIRLHEWNADDGTTSDLGFTSAAWCDVPEVDPWAYGTPETSGETVIVPRVTFGSRDPDALLFPLTTTVTLKPNPTTTDAPRVSIHEIAGLQWEPVAWPHTITISDQQQNHDLALAELTEPSMSRPFWGVHPFSSAATTYDVVRVKAAVSPAIPEGMAGDIHLAWYDPVNTIANVPSTPPVGTTANAARDNVATLTPLFGTTLKYDEEMEENTAYFKINGPRFGDNFVVAAHPREGIEETYYFADECHYGEELRFWEYPLGFYSLNPGKPDFSAPLEELPLAEGGALQTPVVHVLPAVDIDTDSNNDGVVEPDNEAEDAMEDDDVQKLGKRILKNTDDDNKDGIPDVSNLQHTDYKSRNASDDDFAEIRLRLTGSDVADLAGYELWLAQPNGLSLYATEDKKWIVPDSTDPDDDGTRDYDIPTKEATLGGGAWYKWSLGPGADFADTVYAEGKTTGIHDVFWRLVDPATGNILARDTVNIIVIDVLILDGEKIPTGELKVAKWQDAYSGSTPTVKPDFIDFDPDRFYARVVDASKNTDPLTKQTITIELATDSPGDDYDDDPTEIELIETGVDTGVFETKSLMLMGDDVDDDHPVDNVEDDEPNDRTHKIALDGIVKIRYPDISLDVARTAIVPIEKSLTIPHIYILRDDLVSNGGTAVTTEAAVKADVKWANERFSQMGVMVSVGDIVTVDPPSGVNLVDGSLDEYDPVLTDEEKALFDTLGTADTSDIVIFYVNLLSLDSLGEATAESQFLGEADKRLNNTVIASQHSGLTRVVLAHELLHVLIDSGNHTSESYNLLYQIQSLSDLDDGDVNKMRRISPAQATATLESKFVENPQ